jgi:pyrroline-5-carboxylate reductase
MAYVRRPESTDVIRSKLPREALDSTASVHVNDNRAAVLEADVILLAYQPHLYKSLLEESRICAALKGKPIILVLAGFYPREIERHLGEIAHKESKNMSEFYAFSVIRAMPNVASAVQTSSTVLEMDPPPHLKDTIVTAHAIFSCVGTVFTPSRAYFRICTTLTGSTPAFFAMAIDGLVDGAVAFGLTHTEATQMATTTMRATADLITSGKSNNDLNRQCACVYGWTPQGRRVLEKAQTRDVWMQALDATVSG